MRKKRTLTQKGWYIWGFVWGTGWMQQNMMLPINTDHIPYETYNRDMPPFRDIAPKPKDYGDFSEFTFAHIYADVDYGNGYYESGNNDVWLRYTKDGWQECDYDEVLFEQQLKMEEFL